MPHPALVERRTTGLYDDRGTHFNDDFEYDSVAVVVVDQHFRRGAERPPVFYNEISRYSGFDASTIIFDSLIVPFDDGHRLLQNFSSRDSSDSRRRRPTVVVLK